MNLFQRLWQKIIRKTKHCYNISGANNHIIVGDVEYSRIIPGLNVNITGDNNRIVIEDTDNFSSVNLYVRASNCTIKFGRRYETLKSLNNISIIVRNGNNQHLEIGDGTLIWGVAVFMDEENSGLIIGKNCLFSDQITIWTADGHPVFDMATGLRINAAGEAVRIGNNVWIGQGVRITKNAGIPNGCIVGGGSVVSKKFVIPNVAIAGNPAKVIKENVCWQHC